MPNRVPHDAHIYVDADVEVAVEIDADADAGADAVATLPGVQLTCTAPFSRLNTTTASLLLRMFYAAAKPEFIAMHTLDRISLAPEVEACIQTDRLIANTTWMVAARHLAAAAHTPVRSVCCSTVERRRGRFSARRAQVRRGTSRACPSTTATRSALPSLHA